MNASIFSVSPTHDWTRITLEGPDARDFLHRITTAPAHALNPGDGRWACILNAQGKIRASFVLWCEDEERFALECAPLSDGSHLQALLGAIDQFTFSEKMTLKTHENTAHPHVSWAMIEENKFADWWRSTLRNPEAEIPSATQRVSRLVQTPSAGASIRVQHHGSQDFGAV